MITLKIALAAPPEIEAYIGELTEYIKYKIMPSYLTSDECTYFLSMNVLDPQASPVNRYNGLLEEALHIVSSLQVLISVIESLRSQNVDDRARLLFEHNSQKLKEYGFFFPLTIEYFVSDRLHYDYGDSYSYHYAIN